MPRIGRDVATGQPVAYDDQDEANGFGAMSMGLESVPTPIPKAHARGDKIAIKKVKRDSRE